MDGPLGQVPRSQRLNDGQPSQGGYYEASGKRSAGRSPGSPSRLLTGKDEVNLTAPVEVALAIVKESLVEAFRRELNVSCPAVAYGPSRDLEPDPQRVAERMLSEIGALFSAAEAAGVEIDGEILERATRHGAEEALQTIQQLGLSGVECAEAVDRLLAAWAAQLARLSVGDDDEAATDAPA